MKRILLRIITITIIAVMVFNTNIIFADDEDEEKKVEKKTYNEVTPAADQSATWLYGEHSASPEDIGQPCSTIDTLEKRMQSLSFYKNGYIQNEGYNGKDNTKVAIKVRVTKDKNGNISILQNDGTKLTPIDPNAKILFDGDNHTEENEIWYEWVMLEYVKNDNDGWNALLRKVILNVPDNEMPDVEKEWDFTNKIEFIVMRGIEVAGGFAKWASDQVGKAKKIGDVIKEFSKNPVGKVITVISDFRKIIGDFFQSLANMFATGKFESVVYSTEALKENEKYKKKADLVDVGKYENVEDGSKNSKGQIIKQLPKDENDEEQFTDSTCIPVIEVDFYDLAMGNISIFDADIFSKNNKDNSNDSTNKNKTNNKDNKNNNNKNNTNNNEEETNDTLLWRIKRFAIVITKILIYIDAALIIFSIILSALKLMKKSITPNESVAYKGILNKSIKNIAMLIGTVLIMTTSIYFSKMLITGITSKNMEQKVPPFRVHVEDTEYSFSTNLAGYLRYVAEISNINLFIRKGIHAVLYMWVSIANFILALILFARMLAMLFLGIIGLIIIGLQVLEKQNKMHLKYSDWAISYFIISFIQVFVALFYRLVIESTIIKV